MPGVRGLRQSHAGHTVRLDDLDECEGALERLSAGEDARWPTAGRGMTLHLHPHDSGSLSVSVHDPDRLTAALGLEPAAEWIDEHMAHLERIRDAISQR